MSVSLSAPLKREGERIHRILQDAVFLVTDSPQTGGILAVNKRGLVCLCTVNPHSIAAFITQTLLTLPNRQQLAQSLSRRYGLPGSEELLTQAFNQHFASGNYKAAARVAATLKSGALRTPQVLQQFKAVPVQPGQTSAILIYFSTLLECGSLNAIESVELVRPVVVQGRRDFVEKWLDEEKLECTEEVGDALRALDMQLAFRAYKKAHCHQKVLYALAELGRLEEAVEYIKETRPYFQADVSSLLRHLLNTHAERGGRLAQLLLLGPAGTAPEEPLVDVQEVIQVMLQQQQLQQLTSLLLELLKHNKPEQGPLQTQLLEINLQHSPQVAETIFQMEVFTHFDRRRVAALCEKAGLHQRALELFSDLADVKRVMLQAGGKLTQEWLQQFFAEKLSAAAALELLSDLLRASSQNLQTVVGLAIKFHEKIGTQQLVEMFEKFNSYEGLFYFLGSILAFSTDPDIHFKYIEAATKLNHTQEVERVCRESKYYDPHRVKEFLKTNAYYDSKEVGKYCEERDPHLAYVAYRRAWGACDRELVDITNRNGLYRLQARKQLSIKDQVVDSELLYAYAKTDRFEDMEDFLSGTNTANVQAVGDRLFQEKQYK
ncbi:UNVERIFIED_CONTAM: hypothetical protein H355_011899, partial [Colinus virginianus]